MSLHKGSFYYTLAGFSLVFSAPVLAYAQSNVCDTLAKNLTPDTFAQASSSVQFSQLQSVVSDQAYDSFSRAKSDSFDGTLLSEYVDIFVKTTSNESNWGEHRRQFLSMNASVESASSANSVQVSKWNVGAIKAVVACQRDYANKGGFSAVLEKVSDQRDSFTVRLTNSTHGNPAWTLTDFTAQPLDENLHCNNGFTNASFAHPIGLGAMEVLITCRKSPNAHFLLSVQTSAGPAATSFTLESVQEEIKQIREETASKIQALTDRLDKPGIVAAFAATTCPTPWTLYQPAVGRFIRGFDPNGTIDPEGTTRSIGSLQPDAVGSHVHTMGVNGGDSTTMVPGGASQRMPNFQPDPYGGGPKKQTDPNENAAPETRPKNVALLYCILK